MPKMRLSETAIAMSDYTPGLGPVET